MSAAPEKPTALPVNPDTIPETLTALQQWLTWRYKLVDKRWTKPPINAVTGGYAQSNNPATHVAFPAALFAYHNKKKNLDGIGFAFHPGDGLTGLDLDHVIAPDTGELSPDAARILERFKGTYCEYSPSGDGIRIFCYGEARKTGKNKGKWLECYDHTSPRYLTVTGQHITGTATEITEQQEALEWLYAAFFVEKEQEQPEPQPRHERRTADYGTDDTALLDKARSARDGDRFAALFDRGDTSAYGGDDSAADLGLCNLLAFWTDRDPERMDRLFRQSALMRPKWERADYRQWTIDKAIAGCRETYGGRSGGNGEYRQTGDSFHREKRQRDQQEPPGQQDGDPGYSAENDARQTGGQSNSRNNRNSRDSETRTEITLICFNQVKAKPLEWEWYPLFLRRASNLLVGDSDIGKTKALMSIVAIVTRGGVYPGTAVEVPPRNVIMLCAEEDKETMIKPALLAAGADCNRVFLVESCAEFDSRNRMKKRIVTLEHDIEALTSRAIEVGNIGILSIDPITAYLGTRISGNENSAIRSILGGLQSFAETHGNANILLTHFNKDGSKSAKHQVIGSIAFTAGVRSVIGAFRDPEDDTKARRLLVPMKVNQVPESDRFGIAFEIHGKDVIEDGEILPNVGYTVWIPGRVNKTADEIITAQQSQFAESRNEQKEPGLKRQRIIDVLRGAGRPLNARSIAELLYGEEIPVKTDNRRGRVRKLLRDMLAAGQVQQLANEEYALPDYSEAPPHVDM